MTKNILGTYFNMLIATGQMDSFNSQIEKLSRKGSNKVKVIVGKMFNKTAGGRHAWYESNVGLIRKPIQ